MKLCIADPPYLGRAAHWYGDGMHASQKSKEYGGTSKKSGIRPADNHPDAHLWDNIEQHRNLVNTLITEYDGWAIAMAHDNLRDYIPMIPGKVPIRIGIWTKNQTMPGGARVINNYEPVIVRIPDSRKNIIGHAIFPNDSVRIPRLNSGFAGAKPPAWTRWVLDMLGYDAACDTVDDLFPGSGAIAQELAQEVLL